MLSSRNLLMRLFAILCVMMPVTMMCSMGANANSVSARPTNFGVPRYFVFHHHLTAAQLATTQLKHWTASFMSGGKSYTYSMVGTDPGKGSATTKIPATLIPLRIVFSNGKVFDGMQKMQLVTNSPEFKNAPFISGKTQYNDADIRAEFWKYVSTKSKNYHVLFATPKVNADYIMQVPAADGATTIDPSTGKTIGMININWFDPVLRGLLTTLHFTPTMLPIFLSSNVYLTNGAPTIHNCCVGGYHSLTPLGFQTYVFTVSADEGVQHGFSEDVSALSHELGEWLNDPFTTNIVPNWFSPLTPRYGCDPYLEVGDPLASVLFQVKGFPGDHLQDLAFFSWFARQTPSIAIDGLYSYLGTFKGLSKHC